MTNYLHTTSTPSLNLNLFQLKYLLNNHKERHYYDLYNDVMILPRELDNGDLIPRKEQALIVFAS